MRHNVAYRFTKHVSRPVRYEGGFYGQLYNCFGIGFVDMLSFMRSVDGKELGGVQFSEIGYSPVRQARYFLQKILPRLALRPI
jgi:hypothetical protein